jgi:4-methyl-5(b-hydroxyethyl)-thiazole monophosphate biosynthesis
MSNVLLFLTEGFEETEAITVIDLLRRAEINVNTVSLTDSETVTGAHGIAVHADTFFGRVDLNPAEMLVLPGGPGHMNYKTHPGLLALIQKYNAEGKYIAAICAAPVIFGGLNLLVGKKAVCYPGCENELTGAILLPDKVVKDGNIITSKGPGTAPDFALSIIETLKGAAVAEKIAKAFIFERS